MGAHSVKYTHLGPHFYLHHWRLDRMRATLITFDFVRHYMCFFNIIIYSTSKQESVSIRRSLQLN